MRGGVGGRRAVVGRRMGLQAYTIAVAFMAGLGALAALGAVVLAVHHFGRPRPSRRPVFAFDPPLATPVLLREPEPLVPPPEPATSSFATLAEPPAEAGPEPETEPEPVLPPRLELALMSPRAPGRLKLPVDLARGRILELSLPLWVSAAGGCDLQDVKIRILVPNEITYGPSLDRIAREQIAGLPGARTRCLVAEHHTIIEIDVPHLAGGAEAIIPAPIAIKRAAVGAYPIQASASAPALGTIERRYAVELIDPSAEPAADDGAPNWICRPDEAARVRDPHLPLDRIVSTRFDITEPGEDLTEPAPAEV